MSKSQLSKDGNRSVISVGAGSVEDGEREYRDGRESMQDSQQIHGKGTKI